MRIMKNVKRQRKRYVFRARTETWKMNQINIYPSNSLVGLQLVTHESRDLVICNNCLWAASLLNDSYATNLQICPICRKKGLEIIPVSDYEYYTMHIDKRRGIDIEFVKEK